MPERRQNDEAGHQGEDEHQDADGDVEVPQEEGAGHVLVGVVGRPSAFSVEGKPPPGGRPSLTSSSVLCRAAHSDKDSNILLPCSNPECGSGCDEVWLSCACNVACNGVPVA